MGEGPTIEEAYVMWSDDLVRYAAGLVGPAEAPDVVADAFAGLLARGENGWSSVREPRAYVFRSVTNAARMRERSRSRRQRREDRWSAWIDGPAAPEHADPRVAAALRSLSLRQRAAVFLTYWHDLAPRDIAELLGTSEGSVKRHLARARATLREVLR